MLHTKDPSSTYCRRCGTELIWEHPKGSGHCQTSSDYVGGDICRSCLDELRANSAGTADSMTDDATLVPITLFQAPLAVLRERGLLEMYERNRPYTGPVPSQYYIQLYIHQRHPKTSRHECIGYGNKQPPAKHIQLHFQD